ncbi:hypothetical protein [Synechococcus sp. MIT S1220]|uniref:hypothetical protein n=1 Tax=Synechococcus sp. MIT S1220 TaxID=3082549 RepID=UPI0039AF96CC
MNTTQTDLATSLLVGKLKPWNDLATAVSSRRNQPLPIRQIKPFGIGQSPWSAQP